MPTLFQIDSCLGIGSTGRITESIGKLASSRGWKCYIAHGARYTGKTEMNSIPIVTQFGEYRHIIQSLLFDDHGLGSICETKKLIEQIKKIRPDVIQLHCVHGYYVNYKILFDFLNSTTIPIVWTFHDCWAFTGHCGHFVTANCYRWKEEGCHDCPLKGDYPRALIDRSSRNFNLKKKLFTTNKNLHIVAVSNWLASLTRESFLKKNNIIVINNGVDIKRFVPLNNISDSIGKFQIIGVATAWTKDKGLYDFYKLNAILPKDQFEMCLVGLTQKQVDELPNGIKGITRTESIDQLAKLYSQADVFVNPTYADSFPTVNMEALACGTSVITYNTGGSPEIIDEKTGIVVEQGNVKDLANAVLKMKAKTLLSKDCRERAERLYNKDSRFADYVELYESLIKK